MLIQNLDALHVAALHLLRIRAAVTIGERRKIKSRSKGPEVLFELIA